jgi:glycosyltransferase involved in cell wall biosynthesis
MKQREERADLDQPVQSKRPFFSIVISCYNSRKTIGRLLESLTYQNLEKDDLEVIISDDHSTEPYDDIVKEFEEDLNIIYTSTEYNCCPGNTREAGARVATGEWLCFSDHDDKFIETSLGILKDKIIKSQEKYYVITGFISQNAFKYDKEAKEFKASDSGGWTHGKFFNLDNFWKNFDMHYKKDLLSHEDIYITSLATCLIEYLHDNKIEAGTYFDELFTYIWYSHPTSLSHSWSNNGMTFLEEHFIEYVGSTAEVYFTCYKSGYLCWLGAKQMIFNCILLYYFYSIGFIYYKPNDYNRKNFEYLSELLDRVCKEFKTNNTEIWMYASSHDANPFQTAEEKSRIATKGVIPSMTFGQWLEKLHPEGDEHISIYYVKKES